MHGLPRIAMAVHPYRMQELVARHFFAAMFCRIS